VIPRVSAALRTLRYLIPAIKTGYGLPSLAPRMDTSQNHKKAPRCGIIGSTTIFFPTRRGSMTNEQRTVIETQTNIIQTAIKELHENLHYKELQRSQIGGSISDIETAVRTLKGLMAQSSSS
jgi:hypothetical protein